MHNAEGKNILLALRKKWVANSIMSLALMALSAAGFAAVVSGKLFLLSWWWAMPLFALFFAALLLYRRPWQIQTSDVANFLNNKYPALEESAGLLLKPATSLNVLEALQAEKILSALRQISRPPEFIKPLRAAGLTLLLAGIVCIAIAVVPFSPRKENNHPAKSVTLNVEEKILPGIKYTDITITPPLYTRQPVRHQKQFNLHAEDGAVVQWLLQTTSSAKSIKLIFNDSSALTLKPVNTNNTQWQAVKKITGNGFYQVMLDGNLSEFYKIEAIKDEPPVITITSPKPNITIEYGEPERININATVKDDYGVKTASIIATIASGSGEAVKFKEKTIYFSANFKGQLQQYDLQKMIDLHAMDMQPADQLYFYIKAVDNNNQEKRSDIYIATLADTADLMESDVLIGDVKLKPEYFRSERQIIIETEQLLKDKDTIKLQEFNNRSNNLGIDQKLLRLRYGKFLGEENEPGEGVNNQNSTLSDPSNFGNANAVIDAFADKHDNAEDATFFTDDVKKQLKATLTEMWNAETRLRTFKPQEALPYEYKALRLLKDLQQKSRVYVAKTSFRTTPLKPEKRLTGDLSKIIQPDIQITIPKNITGNEIISLSLGELEQLKLPGHAAGGNAQLLQQAMQLLGNKAAGEPAVYLQGLQSLKKVIEALQAGKQPAIAAIQNAEGGLQKMILLPPQLPQKKQQTPANMLEQQYFKTLQKTLHH
ncbi:MAG TPA: DUF4175 family protein [Chitinophagaceae bacterium]|nr:DUF4175 family protein [Chitinophagaceae bacterium]